MHQLVHEVRAKGLAILLLDIANAFDTVDRDLMISLASKGCPELVNLTWWLYKLESRLVTNEGHVIRSSTGTQQGCCLSNPVFALGMKYIEGLLNDIDCLRRPLFYWDDTAIVGTPEALEAAVAIINECTQVTGLRLKWKKCHLHGSPETIQQCSTRAFPPAMTMKAHFNMAYLKAPIGDDRFFSKWLDNST